MRVGRHYAEFSFLERGMNAVVGIVGPTFDPKADGPSPSEADDTILIPARLSEHSYYDENGQYAADADVFCL